MAEQALALASERVRALAAETAELSEALGQARGEAAARQAAVAEAWATLSARLLASEAGSAKLLGAAETLARTEENIWAPPQ